MADSTRDGALREATADALATGDFARFEGIDAHVRGPFLANAIVWEAASAFIDHTQVRTRTQPQTT